MLSKLFVRSGQLHVTTRCFMREINKADKIPAQKSNETVQGSTNVLKSTMHRVSNFDKKILVWVKRYPSIADVPSEVTADCIHKARNKARIKTSNYMIVFTIVGCIFFITLGKKQAARGENLVKQRNEWLEKRWAEDKNK